LRALDNAARYMRDDQFVESLQAAASPAAVIELIQGMDAQHNAAS
jgi:mannitol/fructose-specific phosphotransferase system IIA component (Ntr-type)